ncbi:hypothetical protein GNI_172810 [Gregarina niphandrodes]|uniref:Uncharacterized protein n=1 Tax=Gregarina niphandrodes TaxID=110365 RepID=A0A023AXQ8_GRENI|nr:hypothetical protein GNI_172810 [Gregarina niphandrodes]EZG43426.1 hypothetical protein GNI_172810 [Gregarina niphandrodes]|eukprot:XP_011133346.1 hypothetical protein GNI_172810 [Gregarina niphandrodes]
MSPWIPMPCGDMDDKEVTICNLLDPIEDTTLPADEEERRERELQNAKLQKYIRERAAQNMPAGCCESFVGQILKTVGVHKLLDMLGTYDKIEEADAMLLVQKKMGEISPGRKSLSMRQRTLEHLQQVMEVKEALPINEDDCLILATPDGLL